MRRTATGLFTGATAFWAVVSQNAFAADTSAPIASSPSTFVITLGGAVEYGPKYPGSGHNAFSALPSFDIRRFDEPDENSAPDDSISYGLIDLGGIEIGPALGFRDGRSHVGAPLGRRRRRDTSADRIRAARHLLRPIARAGSCSHKSSTVCPHVTHSVTCGRYIGFCPCGLSVDHIPVAPSDNPACFCCREFPAAYPRQHPS